MNTPTLEEVDQALERARKTLDGERHTLFHLNTYTRPGEEPGAKSNAQGRVTRAQNRVNELEKQRATLVKPEKPRVE